MELVRDSKDTALFNHLEAILHAVLHDAATVAELAAMALYGILVSWPYLRIIRGEDGKTIRNMLDPELITLHQRLPEFCRSIAANPAQLLFSGAGPLDFSKLTLDGKPFMDAMAIAAIQLLADDLPDLLGTISDLFNGAAEGWEQFTQEYAPGGPFDLLTPEQRARIYIPATNDHNEGALGSWRVYHRYHASSTSYGFSNKTRLERNNTEQFISRLCDANDQKYVMKRVRENSASGQQAKFRAKLLEYKMQQALAARAKAEAARLKEQLELERLVTVGLVMDREAVERMTIRQLNDQMKIHIKILGDGVLKRVVKKDLIWRVHRLAAVLAAITRNEGYVLSCYMGIILTPTTAKYAHFTT